MKNPVFKLLKSLSEIYRFGDNRVTYFQNSTQICYGSPGEVDITVSKVDNGYKLSIKISNRYQYTGTKIYDTLEEARKIHDSIVSKILDILDINGAKDFSDHNCLRELESYLIKSNFAFIMRVSDISMSIL